jgi:hypothetical protein
MTDQEFSHLPPQAWDDSAALEIQSVSLAAPGTFFQAWVTNTDAALRYFQLHDVAAALVGAEVPAVVVSIPAGESKLVTLGRRGREFTTGITWGMSTTAATFTATGAVAFVSLGYDAV